MTEELAVSADNRWIELHRNGTRRWAHRCDGLVVCTAPLLEGRVIAAVIERHGDHLLVVLGSRDGAVLHRLAVVGFSLARFAAGRGIALLRCGDRRILAVDLRYGRVLFDRTSERVVADLAIDDAGTQLTIRDDEPNGELHSLPFHELGQLSQPDDDAALRPVDTSERVEPPASQEPRAEPLDREAIAARLHELSACSPRRHATMDREAACRLLDIELSVVAAIVARAVAREWDRGTIAFQAADAAPFRAEMEGIVGDVHGLAADELRAAEARLEVVRERAVRLLEDVPAASAPLDAIAGELGLSVLASAILMVAAAPLLRGELARPYGILANDAGRPLCDEQLVATILKDRASAHEIARELDSTSALVRSGAIRLGLGAARPFLPLVVDPAILARLRGLDERPTRPPRSLFELQLPDELLSRFLEDIERVTGPLRLVVRGKRDAGRTELVELLAAHAGRALALVDARAREPGATGDELRAKLQQAHLAGAFPLVDGLDTLDQAERGYREYVRAALRQHAGPVAILLGKGTEVPCDPGYVLVELPTPTIGERMAAWADVTARLEEPELDIAVLAQRYPVGRTVIERVVDELTGTADLTTERLDRALRQYILRDVGAIADRVERLATWSQVVLPQDIHDSLTELVGRIRHRHTVFETWGFDRVTSTARGVTALFQGGPGTGKTLVAGAIANDLGVDLYRVDLSRVMSKWIGETEQNLAKLFDAAEASNAIILFDEADSLFAKRTEVKGSTDRYANLEVNYLLQRLDSFEGIAILTTNLATSLDPALKRRMSFRLTFPFPDDEERERLWRAHLPSQMPRSGDIDLKALAQRYRLSGGYIRNGALRAAFLAAEEGSPLTSDHLHRAVAAEYREIGKLADGGILE